jgi:hypothetical protein
MMRRELQDSRREAAARTHDARAALPEAVLAQVAENDRARAGAMAAAKFLGRIAQLELGELGVAVQAWHQAAGAAWFAAEDEVAQAITAAARDAEQEVLLEQIAHLFRSVKWFTPEQPGARIHASEPSGQYVCTIAMLALLVRDRIAPADFTLLYRPFATLIPTEELDRE